MNLESLGSILRAIRVIEPSRRIILFGASSLLASFPSDSPESLGVEITIDADVFLDPDDAELRRSLTRVMGQSRQYHIDHGFYCDFVDARADGWFPLGWKQRIIPFPGIENVFAMQATDVAAAKLVASAHSRVDFRMGRRTHDRGSKDIETVAALLTSGRLAEDDIIQRIKSIELEPAYVAEIGQVLVQLRQMLGGVNS